MRNANALRLAAALAAATLLVGCGDGDVGLELPNDPPTTEIVSPLLSGETVSYRLVVSWRGEDADGAVSGFEFAIDDTALWSLTMAFDSVFTFESPACCSPDTIVLPDSTVMIDSIATGSHTFFVRAIDDEGSEDPTPARIAFTSTTLTPETEIYRGPGGSESTPPSPPSVTFAWYANDPDGTIAGYRYRLDDLPWTSVGADCTRVVFADLSTSVFGGDDGRHRFSVLAVDNAGAMERTADVTENVREWIAMGSPYNYLCIESSVNTRSCGERGFDQFFYSGNPLAFDWTLDAESYGARAICYSYSYDWEDFSPCARELRQYPVSGQGFVPEEGEHILQVRAFDDLGQSFQARVYFSVGDFRPDERGGVLYIDDFSEGSGTGGNFWPDDFKEEAYWDTLLTGFSFSKFDAERFNDIPTPRNIGQASTVIWSVDENSQLETSSDPSNFRNPLAGLLDDRRNLILCGTLPIQALPVDVTPTGVPIDTLRECTAEIGECVEWFPTSCETTLNFQWDYLRLTRSCHDPAADRLARLQSSGVMFPDGSAMPDLPLDLGKRGNLPDGTPALSLGLERCERYVLNLPGRGTVEGIPLWLFVDVDGTLKEVCAFYVPRDEATRRGHVVVLGFSPYFFDTLQMQEVFRRILILFGEYFDPG